MIDDLERVRRFRSDELGPSDTARAQARDALASRWREPASSPVPADRVARASRFGRTRRWVPRGVAAGLALAACVVVIGLVAGGTDTGPPPALAAALGQLAKIAASGPSLVPGPGQYLYADSQNHYAAIAGLTRDRECITYAPDHRQLWISASGSGLLQDTTGRATFTSRADQALCAKSHTPVPTKGVSRQWFAAGCFTLGPGDDMQALSTNPRVLLRQMRRLDGGPRTPAEDFVHVGDFLRETDASPAVRAALYQAAALIPGVRLLGIVRDHLGRKGLGVAYDSYGVRDELIFNPHTSALMGEQSTGHQPGTSYWAVYLTSRVVDRLPHQSPLPLKPPCANYTGYITQTPQGTVETGKRTSAP